jgi:D-glycero-D-manno-heptose 1,7-bisphosphate phosphatase
MIDSVHRFLDPAGAALARPTTRPRALFLDRDGVINVDNGYVHTAEKTQWMPGIFALCQRGIAAGYLPIVATNQAGIGRGFYTDAEFLEHTRWLHAEFRAREALLMATYYCPHHPTEGVGGHAVECTCRKPAPGLFIAAEADFALDMENSIMIGDKASDLRAARDAGVRTCLLLGDAHELPRSPEGTCAIASLDVVFADQCSEPALRWQVET